VRIICGEFWGKRGPVEGVAADPITSNLGCSGPAEAAQNRDHPQRLCLRVRGLGHVPRVLGTARGSDRAGRETGCAAIYDVGNHSLVLFDRGDEIVVQAGDEGIRFLLVSASRLKSRLPGTVRL